MKKLALSFLIIVIACSVSQSAEIDNSDLYTLLSPTFEGDLEIFPLGRYSVRWDVNYAFKKETKVISQKFLEALLVYEKLGIVELPEKKRAGGPETVVEFVTIKATDKGRQIEWKLKDSNEYMVIIMRAAKWQVITNDEIKVGLDDCRVVNLMLEYKMTQPVYREFCALTKRPLPEKEKVQVLIRFDVFDKKWKIVTYDRTPSDKEFTTNKVKMRLASGRITE